MSQRRRAAVITSRCLVAWAVFLLAVPSVGGCTHCSEGGGATPPATQVRRHGPWYARLRAIYDLEGAVEQYKEDKGALPASMAELKRWAADFEWEEVPFTCPCHGAPYELGVCPYGPYVAETHPAEQHMLLIGGGDLSRDPVTGETTIIGELPSESRGRGQEYGQK